LWGSDISSKYEGWLFPLFLILSIILHAYLILSLSISNDNNSGVTKKEITFSMFTLKQEHTPKPQPSKQIKTGVPKPKTVEKTIVRKRIIPSKGVKEVKTIKPISEAIQASPEITPEDNSEITYLDKAPLPSSQKFEPLFDKTAYDKTVRKIISENKEYPFMARRRKIQGSVIINFIIKRDGNLKELSISESSGFNVLDSATYELIKRSAPFPPTPEEMEFTIPITFKIE